MPCTSRWPKHLLPALLVAVPGVAAAIEPLDTFNFSVGTYVSRMDTRVRADGETTGGTSVDLRRDLGLDIDGSIAYARLSWRPFARHEFGTSYFSDGMDSEHRLQRDIDFEDHLYQASATVRAEYDVDTLEAWYTWWGFSSGNWALGPRLGVTWYRIELGLALQLDVNGDPVGSGGLSDTFRGDLPAPTLGASWRWTPAEDWRISADVGWLSAEINNIDANVGHGRLGVEWHPWRHAGLMLDYQYTDVRASTERQHFTGHLNLRDAGLRFGLVVRY